VSVFDLDRQNPVSHVDWMPVWAEAGSLAQAAAVRIHRARSVDHVLFATPSEDAAGDAAVTRSASWRVGEIETNARMLFYRGTPDQPFARVALVDGSLARAGGRRGFEITPPAIAPALFINTPGDPGSATGNQDTRTTHPCAASPVS
jgi:hypothetical protein